MAELLYRLGKTAARRAWAFVIAWVALLGIAGGALALGMGPLSSSFDIPNTPSSVVIDDLNEKLPDFAGASGTVVFHTDDGSALTDDQRAQISDLAASAADLPDVNAVIDPFQTEDERAAQAQEIADGRTQIEQGRTQLDDALAQLDAGQTQLDAGQAQLDAGQAQLDAGRAQLEAAGAPPAAFAQLDAQQAQLDAQQAQLDAQQAQVDAGRTQAEDGLAELETNSTQLDLGAQLLDLADGIRVVSEDGSAAIVNVAYTETRMELPQSSKDATIEHFRSVEIPGLSADFSTDIAQGVPKILGISEVIGVIVAAVVLLVMLGSAIAASFPIITALVGVGTGVMATLAFSGVIQMTSVTPILGVMLGLAVGIDYSLFIVNRHRKQLLQGAEVTESIGLANGTAGNAVVFAGSTVIVALLALNVTGVPFLGLMGTAGAICVAVAVLVAITLTPALLGLAKERVLTRKERAKAEIAAAAFEDGADHSTATTPVRPMPTWRAALTTVVAVVALLVVAIPTMSMRLGLPDGGSEPEDSTTFASFTVIEEKFGAGVNGPLLVTAALPDAVAEEDLLARQVELATQFAALDDVVAVAPIGADADRTLLAFQLVPAEGPNSLTTDALVKDLRANATLEDGTELGVAGQAAINIDISDSLADVLPGYIALVVGLSLLIMIVVFRSLLVPLIATGGFILSLLATLGAIVAVFQWGWLAGIFGVTTPGPILSFLPVILVGILFGLAMDYQLFLATGMREAYVHGSPARLAVAQGFRAGRSVVIAAGLIMVSVFGGFVFAESAIVRLMGFGLAVGVLLDAFVVRLLLMPAVMHLIGQSAWWLPRWLDRILPNVDVEGSALERRHHLR